MGVCCKVPGSWGGQAHMIGDRRGAGRHEKQISPSPPQLAALLQGPLARQGHRNAPQRHVPERGAFNGYCHDASGTASRAAWPPSRLSEVPHMNCGSWR
eukprot:CAMPEP_0173391708 /NCGR_PEP_ID=MMETSP1356-20130122/18542_1 /TAXON_ID=77927 ORGANISM="Hemiselmis virescens, Strain PCC157" /NCGR_SAMPLE_ID=MMETSP1356 /ASSEMBLY_ACC=CAM_ASM_000847 /LENGTH=98 /DNA_ID=CAMNT_0014349383 /DNA_START=47 /DNA_END=343 /DNA_ORIENTATION=-